MEDGQCPAYRFFDSGDFADPERCDRSVEHNIDGSWHESSWVTDDQEVSVRWAPEIGEYSRWPRYGYDPLGKIAARLWGDRIVEQITRLGALDKNLPVAPGSTINLRKWASLPRADV